MFAVTTTLFSCSDPQPFGDKELDEALAQNQASADSRTGSKDGIDSVANGSADPFSRTNDGNAKTVKDLENGARLETFEFGGNSQSELVDYLFVLDNSCSMEGIGSKLASGFLSLVGSDLLPKKAQLAVMSTMHADENDFSKTGIGIQTYPGIELEPGFLSFVNQKAISKYKRSVSANEQSNWALDGCENSWFSPDAKAKDGSWCIEAATQATNSCVGAEAGIRAYSQLMQKYENARLFRRSAILNVIFVSDTHDPGTSIDALQKGIKAYNELKAMTLKSNPLAGVKFHALAPSGTRCTFERLYDESYNRLAKESGGLSQDPCNFDSYDVFMENMVSAGLKPESPIFSLTKPIDEIIEISINGSPINDYKIVDPYTVRIDGLSNAEAAVVEIIYSHKG
jgi:hypothetical protein